MQSVNNHLKPQISRTSLFLQKFYRETKALGIDDLSETFLKNGTELLNVSIAQLHNLSIF